ncbi:MAG TPA: aldo/keto reductase [Gemmatimonadaceae bacterium]|nr:aldo/keto reductase [Gemmatimonadaceae bacterium]
MPNSQAETRSKHQRARGSAIAGHATAAGTKRFVQRFSADYSPEFYRGLSSNVSVSSIGMGTYLGDCDDVEDARYVTVLAAGLEHGLNLLDTAINYRCQRSERAVGEAIRKAVDVGLAQRDEIVVATKGGYIPLEGSPPESRHLYDVYLASEYFDKGIMTAEDVVSGGHSLNPAFLANQIQRSLMNLGLATIDIYYLHNPEQQRVALDRPRFRSVITSAFAELESQVRRGTIQCYGCATWHGFRLDPASPGHLNLEELVEVARETGGDDHHFRVVQLPLNLAMTEAVRLPTQTVDGQRVSLLEAAAALGVSVVASASLMQSQLTRGLPSELAVAFPSLTTDAQRALAFVRTMPLPLCAALVGMRRLDHLSENLGAAKEVIVS